MEANAVIWIWNYISFTLHYHFMVVMTVRRWNIYRLFRRHLSNTVPEGHLGLKIHYPLKSSALNPNSCISQSELFPFQHLRPWLVRSPSTPAPTLSWMWGEMGLQPQWPQSVKWARGSCLSAALGLDFILVLSQVLLFKLFARWSPTLEWSH